VFIGGDRVAYGKEINMDGCVLYWYFSHVYWQIACKIQEQLGLSRCMKKLWMVIYLFYNRSVEHIP
jgi:hypothetical protein